MFCLVVKWLLESESVGKVGGFMHVTAGVECGVVRDEVAWEKR